MRKTTTPARDFESEFKAQKSITKKQALKLRQGSIVETKWIDGPNRKGIVVSRPTDQTGGLQIRVVLDDEQWNTHVVHTQIVKVHPVNVFSLLTDL